MDKGKKKTMTYSELGKCVRKQYDEAYGKGEWNKLPKEKKAYILNKYLKEQVA